MKKRDYIELFISDLHFPFAHKDWYEFLKAVNKKYRLNDIYIMGDEADFHNLGQWVKNPDGFGAVEEYSKLIKEMKKLYKLFPSAKVCIGNHTARPFRKAFDVGIPSLFLKSYKEFLQAPDAWEWGTEFITKFDALVMHGDGLSGGSGRGLKVLMSRMRSIIYGHWHTEAAIRYFANQDALLYAMAVGCLVDHKKYAFLYQKTNPVKPILTIGLTVNGVPRLIPMRLNKNGRWDRGVE